MLGKLKRILSITMSIAILSTSFTACGKSETKNTNNNANEQNSGKISEKERVVNVVISDNPNQPIKNFAPAQQEIFKQTNIKLQFEVVPSSNYEDKKKILLATNNIPEIIQISQQEINDFGSLGIFLPLNRYMGLMPNFKKLWDGNQDLKDIIIDGELYGFPVISREEAKNGVGPVIRTDLLEKNNLKTPSTFDELLTTLAKLKEIYPKSVPWSIRNGTKQLLKTSAYMLGSGFGIYFDKDVNGGKYVYGPATPEFKEVLSYFNRAYKMGVLDPDYAVATSQQWTEKLTSGKSFFFLDNSGFALNNTRIIRKAEPNAKFQVIPVLENKYGKKRADFYQTKYTGRIFAVNAKIKDPDTIIKFMDWMYTEKASNITNFGVEGVNFTLDEKGQPKFKEDFVAKYKESQPTPYYAIYTELGITKLNFSLWATNTMTQFQIEKMTGNWDDLNDEYWKIIGNDKAYSDPVSDPALTKEEAAKIKEINSTLNTMLEQEYNKFIMGTKKIDEYDAVIKKARDIGAAEIEKIYNNARERMSKK